MINTNGPDTTKHGQKSDSIFKLYISISPLFIYISKIPAKAYIISKSESQGLVTEKALAEEFTEYR